jgi:uncharacterized SAM-binding protein YcdF (DUF218 family)
MFSAKTQPALVIIGLILTAVSSYMLAAVNFNLGPLFSLIVSLLILFWGLYYQRINAFLNQTRWGRICKYSILAAVAAAFLLAAFITWFGLKDTADFREDAVIVLGAGIRGETVSQVLALRLDRCWEYHQHNPGALIIVSGGQGPQESISEALAMKQYLIRRGVPEEFILMEEQAVSTWGNFTYSREILDALFTDRPYRVTYITNFFHAYRASLAAAASGLDATHYSASLRWYMLAPNYLRELPAVLKTWILGP